MEAESLAANMSHAEDNELMDSPTSVQVDRGRMVVDGIGPDSDQSSDSPTLQRRSTISTFASARPLEDSASSNVEGLYRSRSAVELRRRAAFTHGLSPRGSLWQPGFVSSTKLLGQTPFGIPTSEISVAMGLPVAPIPELTVAEKEPPLPRRLPRASGLEGVDESPRSTLHSSQSTKFGRTNLPERPGPDQRARVKVSSASLTSVHQRQARSHPPSSPPSIPDNYSSRGPPIRPMATDDSATGAMPTTGPERSMTAMAVAKRKAYNKNLQEFDQVGKLDRWMQEAKGLVYHSCPPSPASTSSMSSLASASSFSPSTGERGGGGTDNRGSPRRSCLVCSAELNRYRWRHCCRICRGAVCAPCSKARVEVPGYAGLQRACSRCTSANRPLVPSPPMPLPSPRQQSEHPPLLRSSEMPISPVGSNFPFSPASFAARGIGAGVGKEVVMSEERQPEVTVPQEVAQRIMAIPITDWRPSGNENSALEPCEFDTGVRAQGGVGMLASNGKPQDNENRGCEGRMIRTRGVLDEQSGCQKGIEKEENVGASQDEEEG
ncbi:unnamed protein product, partial [Discosporangium mesarthrocarpum]